LNAYAYVVDSFVPGSLCTVCKKQVTREGTEAQAYRGLMDDSLCEVVPKFYREFQQNDEGESVTQGHYLQTKPKPPVMIIRWPLENNLIV